MPNQRRSDSTGLQQMVRILRRRIAAVALCAVLVPGAALAVSLIQEKQYSASASLLFRDPGLDQKLFNSTLISPSTDPTREAATNVKLVSLEAVADRTAQRLGGITGDALKSKVQVEQEGQSDVVSVLATDPVPSVAAAVANSFAREYIAFRRAADRLKVRDAQGLVQRELDGLSFSERAGQRGRTLEDRAQELEILSSLQTGNAELVQRAKPPSSPSSPRPVRNTFLGLILGLLLGVGLAFMLERLDRRLRDPKEVEDTFKRPLLAAVPHSRALAERSPGSLSGAPNAEEAFQMLRANLRYFNSDRQIESVIITSAAPGDGKSTIALNLAAAAAGTGSRVLLIDADLRHPTLAGRLGIDITPGLSDVLAGVRDVSDVTRQIEVGPSGNGDRPARTLDVVVSGPLPPNPQDLVESDRMRRVVETAEGQYDLVIVDTPPTSVVADAIPLVKAVSGVIVVTRLGKSTRDAANALHEQLENLGANTLGVIVNAVRSTAGYGYGYGYGYGSRKADGTEVDGRKNGHRGEGIPAKVRSLLRR